MERSRAHLPIDHWPLSPIYSRLKAFRTQAQAAEATVTKELLLPHQIEKLSIATTIQSHLCLNIEPHLDLFGQTPIYKRRIFDLQVRLDASAVPVVIR